MSNSLMLDNQKFKFVLIEDSVKFCGRKVFKSFVKAFSKETENIGVLTYDYPPEKLYSDLDIPFLQSKIVNAFPDPLNWKSTGFNYVSINMLQTISDANHRNNTMVLCIDSLTSLYLHNGIDHLYRSIHSLLQTKYFQLVALLHGDVLSSSECNMLKSISSITYSLAADNAMLCFENHSHAKLSQSYVEYNIENGFELKLRPMTVNKTKVGDSAQPDPTAHLTFNLKLKNDEKEDRDKLQLPYIKSDDEIDFTAKNFFCKDSYEDDPDDDLDF